MLIPANMQSDNIRRNLSSLGAAYSKSAARLASGHRINSAADDAAGLAVSESMKAQIFGLRRAQRNVEEGIDLIRTMEGGMDGIQEMMIRQRELLVQGLNGTYTAEDRIKIQMEIDRLTEETASLADRVTYNTIPLLNVSNEGARPILDYEYEYAINTLTGVSRIVAPTALVPGIRYFDRAVTSAPAVAELSLNGIDLDGGVAQLHGKSFEIAVESYTARYNLGAGINYDDGAVITLPATGTVRSYLQSAAFLNEINNYLDYDDLLTKVEVTAQGTVKLYASVRQYEDYISGLWSEELGTYFTVPNIYTDGSHANGWAVSVYDDGISLNKLDGSKGSQYFTGASKANPITTGQLSFNLQDSYTETDYQTLLENYLYVNISNVQHVIRFSENPGANEIKVYEGITGDEIEAAIRNALENRIGFTVTNRSDDYYGWVTYNVSLNSPYTPFFNEFRYVKPGTPPSADYQTAYWSAWTPFRDSFTVPGVPNPFSVTSVVAGADIQIQTATVKWDSAAILASLANGGSVTVNGYRFYVPPPGLPALPYDTATAQYLRTPAFPTNGTNVSAYTAQQLETAIVAAVRNSFPDASVSYEANGVMTVRKVLTGSPPIDVRVSGSAAQTIYYDTRTLIPGKGTPGTPAVSNSSLFAAQSNNFTREYEYELTVPLNIPAIKANGAGFVYLGAEYEFYSGTQKDSSVSGIDISGAETIEDFAAAVQKALGDAATVSPTQKNELILAAKNRYAALVSGIWRTESLFTQSTVFSGGAPTGKPGTVIDFSGVSKDDLICTGFTVYCASCQGEWINIIFLDKAAPDYFPGGYEGVDASTGETVRFKNLVVDLSGFSGSEGIAAYIEKYLRENKMLEHYTGVTYQSPDALIFEDKRRGDLPASVSPGRGKVEPEIRSNFEIADFVKKPIFGDPEIVPPRLWIQSGANSSQGAYIDLYDCRPASLYKNITSAPISVLSNEEAAASLTALDQALGVINGYRAKAGAQQNRLEFASPSLGMAFTNLEEANSRIVNADMAKEKLAAVKQNLLRQAGISLLVQVSRESERVFELLK